MVTVLDRNGNIYREIYARGDSAFMSGNSSHNPFLFDLTPDWNINYYDTTSTYKLFEKEKHFNVKISRKANSIEDYSKNIRCDKDVQSFAAPEEHLFKKMRWFYTNYSLNVIYKKIQYEVPISIGNYLSKEEQILWTQGGFCNYKEINGFEMNDCLNEINDKFMKWYGRNLFEFSLEGIKKLSENFDLDKDKENVYKKWTDSVKMDTMDIEPKTVCNVLDSFYKTTYFSKLYNTNHEILDKDFNQQQSESIEKIDLGKEISYELVIPGEILQTNAPIIRSDTLVWKVDGIRLLFNDYSLEAEYRAINKWSFLLTGLLIIISIVSIVSLRRRRRIYSDKLL